MIYFISYSLYLYSERKLSEKFPRLSDFLYFPLATIFDTFIHLLKSIQSMLKYFAVFVILLSFISLNLPADLTRTTSTAVSTISLDDNLSLEKENTTEAYAGYLTTHTNNELVEKLNKRLAKNKKYARLIRNKKLAVGIVDMSDPQQARYAAVNGQEMMYAASLPKIAVLLAAMDAIEKGELKKTAAVTRDMNLMIRKSNNAASTRMIDRVGFDKIQEVMMDPQYNLYDLMNGGLWVGKRYAAAGKRNPDPIKGLSHAASVEKVCNYYYMLSQGQLVSPERSLEMMSYLVKPGINHKFVNTLSRLAPNAKLYRKSGSWRTYHSDSVWVNGPDRNYILVALIDDASGERIARDLVNVAEDILK